MEKRLSGPSGPARRLYPLIPWGRERGLRLAAFISARPSGGDPLGTTPRPSGSLQAPRPRRLSAPSPVTVWARHEAYDAIPRRAPQAISIVRTTSIDVAKNAGRTLTSFFSGVGRPAETAGCRDYLGGRLDILPPEERQLILEGWNRTGADYPRKCRVHELFEAQAQRTPNRVAASFGGRRLTYRELGEKANLLAIHLSELGVGTDDRVALHLERSLDMLVALLGILKAGASYVPLDPNYPRESLEFVLEDSRPRVLLTQQRLRNRLQPGSATVLLIDALPPVPPEPAPSPGLGDIAYVIYTSGSTGKPKGVQVPHQAIVNFLSAMQREPGITSDDKLLAVTSLSFDIAALELFLPLVTGAHVVIAAADVTNDGRRLAALLKSSGATIMQATPSTWRMLGAAGWEGNAGLKILCGGEAWPLKLANALLSRCSSLWNYGPTETTIWSAAARIMVGQPVLIGPPIANTTFYVLDPGSQVVPLGVPGELYIGGDGVTRGYLNRPELTSERFIPDPFSERIGARLYRTGDLVRQLSNGRFEFLGRLDFQVKVRGFRIELGEIEAILRTHPSVQDATVIALDGEEGGKRLVAFVTPNGVADLPVGGLREFLRLKAPPHMTPAAIVALEAFPLTPNGKVDRKALALRHDRAQPTSDSAFVAPRTPLEELVAGLWCDCLEIKEVGLHDNFFELGGDSLSVVHLSLEIERATGVSLPMSFIFVSPTVFEIAKALDVPQPAGSYTPVVLLRPGGGAPPVFMLPGMFGSSSDVMPIVSDFPGRMPIYGLEARGLNGIDPPFDSVEEMAESYIDAITGLQPRGPYFLVGKCFGGLVAMEMARRLSERGEDIGLLALLDAFPHPRLWPLHLRIAYFGHSTAENLTKALRRLPIRSVPGYLAGRIVRAPRNFARFVGKGGAFGEPPEKFPASAKAVFHAAAEAQVRYKPRHYPGKVDFLMCGLHMYAPKAHSAIWRKWIGDYEEEALPKEYIWPEGKVGEYTASWFFDRIQRGLSRSPSARSEA
jgi:surfactin family lipopeptide synthetase A